MFIAEINVTKC